MNQKIIWYFDFISPFAYLQQTQLKQLPENCEIEYKPVLFAGLLSHWGNVGPAEIPPKRQFTYQYCHWLAGKMKVEFKLPPAHPFLSLAALRLTVASNNNKQVIEAIFDAIWKYGMSLDDAATWSWLSKQVSIQEAVKLMESPEVKEQLRHNTEQAASFQVFGVPTLRINQHNFWGMDGFDMAMDYLANPDHFFDEEMDRLVNLPEGVQRKR